MLRPLGHRPALDGVRAIAIVAVMGLHAIDRLFLGGFFGVDVFFVLSAFLITSLILDETNTGAGRYRFRDFYLRRAFRLGPALLLWLAFIALPTALVIEQGSGILVWTLGSVFYVGDFMVASGVADGNAYTHVWSLAVEEQFYLIWPVVLVLLWRRSGGLRVAQWAAAALFFALSVETVSSYVLSHNYFLPTGHLLPLAFGVAAACVYAGGGGLRLERVLRCSAVAYVSVLVLAVAICGYRFVIPIGAQQLQLLVSIATAVLILHLCLAERSLPQRVLAWAPMLWLGRRSYGLYLYHRTLAILIPALFPGLTLRYAGPLVLVIAFVQAEGSFRWVEYPVLRRGRRWLKNRRSPTGASSEEPAAVKQTAVPPSP